MSIKKIENNNKLAQDMIILIAGLQDAGMYKEADVLSAKYALFKEAQSEFMNVIDEESRQILEFAHPGDCEIIPTKSDLGKIHTDTSRQLKIIETLNHSPAKNIVAMAEEALGFKKKAQEKDELEEALSENVVSKEFENVNKDILLFNSKKTESYDVELNNIKTNVLLQIDQSKLFENKNLLDLYLKQYKKEKQYALLNKKLDSINFKEINFDKDAAKSNLIAFVTKSLSQSGIAGMNYLYNLFAQPFPQIAENYFKGTNHSDKVSFETGSWLYANHSVLDENDLIVILNDYKQKNNAYLKKETSVLNAELTLVLLSGTKWHEHISTIRNTIDPVSNISKRIWDSTIANDPDDIKKRKEFAYRSSRLKLDPSLNNENISAACNAIIEELVSDRNNILDSLQTFREFINSSLNFTSLNEIKIINNKKDVGNVISVVLNNEALINSNNLLFQEFIKKTNLNIQNNIVQILHELSVLLNKIKEQCYILSPESKNMANYASNFKSKVTPLVRMWRKEQASSNDEKFKKQIDIYIGKINSFWGALKNNTSIEGISSATSANSGPFKIKSIEDINNLIVALEYDANQYFGSNNLSQNTETREVNLDDVEINYSKKETPTAGQYTTTSSKFLIDNFVKNSQGTGFVPGKSDNTQKQQPSGSANKPWVQNSTIPGVSFNGEKLKELQKAINDALGVTEDPSKLSKDQPKSSIGVQALKPDGVWGYITKEALEAVNKHYSLNLPVISEQTIQQIINKIKQVKSARPTQRYLIKLDSGEVYYNDLLSLASFQKMLERLNPTREEFTFQEWADIIQDIQNEALKETTISFNKADIHNRLNGIRLALSLIIQNANSTFETLSNVVLPKRVIEETSRSSNQFGASNTSKKNPQRHGNAFFNKEQDGENESAQDKLITLSNLAPFDGKYIYLKNIAELTHTEDASDYYGTPSLPMSMFNSSPEVSAVDLFPTYKEPIPAYKSFLEGLKRGLAISKKAYLNKLTEEGWTQYQVEAAQKQLNIYFEKYMTAINRSLNKINRPIRTPWK